MRSELLLGTAIGDAFGVGVEMQSRNLLSGISFNRWHNLRRDQYAQNYTPREYSDDTEHAIGLAKALISEQPFTEVLLLQCWLAEYKGDLERKGYPRQGHGSIERYYRNDITIEELKHSQAIRKHPGNAPAMRAAPLGLLPEVELFRYAEINANATHPHEEARIASRLVAFAAHFLLYGREHADLLHCCANKAEFSTIKKQLLLINNFGAPEELSERQYKTLCGQQPIRISNKNIIGLPSSALHTALTATYILKHTIDPFLGLQRAIRIGGDVDSLACIVVGILVGRYGLDSIPEFMINEVEGNDMLLQLGAKLDQIIHRKFSSS